MTVPIVSTLNAKAKCEWGDDNSFELSFSVPSGLYSLEIQLDLEEFDWDSLYMPMTKYENHGERTGPWDFDLYNENTPLIPTWKIFRNDEYIGLLHMQRLTIEDLERKTSRCEFSFLVSSEVKDNPTIGDSKDALVVFKGEPFNKTKIRPIAMVLEEHPFDVMEPQSWAKKGKEANWAWNVPGRDGWSEVSSKISNTPYESILTHVLDNAVETDPENGVRFIKTPFLTAAAMLYRLKKDEEIKTLILDSIEKFLLLPAWGNQNPYGYGYNGDMGCGEIIKQLSVVYNWLYDDLGDIRDKLLERISTQMELFFTQQLLFVEYWGGACSQDHGFRSTFMMAFAAINMLGHSPNAAIYLNFYIPRMRRVVDKMPLDGYIPFAQYHKIELYVNDAADFRLAYLFASGIDVFDHTPAFGNIPQYILSTLDDKTMNYLSSVTRGDRKEFTESLPFLIMLEQKYDCAKSAYLVERLIDYYSGKSFQNLTGNTYKTISTAILAWNGREFRETTRPTINALSVFPDGGGIQYKDGKARFNVAVMCQPNASSFHSMGTDLNSNDRSVSNPSSGGFSVSVGSEPLIQNAESGYRTGSKLGNVLIVDGYGQIGDDGYPMGVPMTQWRGERIQNWRWNDESKSGFARLQLTSAYPDKMEILRYTRDFHFERERLCVTDTVVARKKHFFAYYFNTYRKHEVEMISDSECVIHGDNNSLRFAISGTACELSVENTEILWAYCN